MARFVLMPCKLREEWLVPQKDTEPLTLNWRELCELLAPSREAKALQVLQLVQVNSFIGLVRAPGKQALANFVLTNADRSGSLERVMKKDPTFASRLHSVYRVDEVRWDARVTEVQGTTSRPGVP